MDTALPIRIFKRGDELGNDSSLYFLPYDSHCYVVFNWAEKKTCLIADGGNQFEQDNVKIRNLLGAIPQQVGYDGQRNADYCASSAIIIVLEFGRFFRTGVVPKKLYYDKTLKSKVEQQLHKYDTCPISDKALYFNLKYLEACVKCGKGFEKRQAHASHQRLCNKGQ